MKRVFNPSGPILSSDSSLSVILESSLRVDDKKVLGAVEVEVEVDVEFEEVDIEFEFEDEFVRRVLDPSSARHVHGLGRVSTKYSVGLVEGFVGYCMGVWGLHSSTRALEHSTFSSTNKARPLIYAMDGRRSNKLRAVLIQQPGQPINFLIYISRIECILPPN
jgi:hypothetical protein